MTLKPKEVASPDPYFFPLYEEAQRLDMPICVHIGSGLPDFPSAEVFEYARFMRTRLAAVNAAYSLIALEIPQKFPTLRVGIVEAGASWVPFVKYCLTRWAKRREESTISCSQCRVHRRQ